MTKRIVLQWLTSDGFKMFDAEENRFWFPTRSYTREQLIELRAAIDEALAIETVSGSCEVTDG